MPIFNPTPSAHPHHPVVFEEFFELGQQESVSPFLTPETRHWGTNLYLKASILAAFLLVLSFSFSFFPKLHPLSNFILIIVYFLAGIPSLIESLENLTDLDINIDVLMTLAAFSSVLIGSGMEGGLLLVLFSLSGSIEEAVETKAKRAISSLHKLSPTRASVIDVDGTLLEKAIDDIEVGTKILIKSGQVVPLDGLVVDGISSVNLVHLTGESMPITKKIGDQVGAGALNLEGTLTLTVVRTSADSTLARIIQLVTQAQEAKPTIQRWFDKLSRAYAITIILLAAFFATTLPFILGLPFLGVEGSVYRALAFLIAASPCALIIAIPIAYLSAISVCAQRGILLKGGITLDAIASCSAVAFDKTGTLTTGKLTCLGLEPLFPSAESVHNVSSALAAAHAMERNAIHPIAKAVLNYAISQQIPPAHLKNFKAIPGYGLEAVANTSQGECNAYIGHPEYIVSQLSPPLAARLSSLVEEVKSHGELLAIMLYGEQLYLFRFEDALRPGIKKMIKALKEKWHWRLIMLTGDHESSAKKVATELGIDEYHADLRPEDKLKYVSELSQKDGLAMIGDGINDAPALARATVGIGMGNIGSTAAIEASDVVLLHDNIEMLDWLIGKAHQTKRIVTQNLSLAVCAILIAALPALAGVVPLWLAVVMHEGGTVLVGLNALRLLRQ